MNKIPSVKVRNKRGENALHEAAATGHLAAVQLLSDYIDSDMKTFRHYTPLHYAILNKRLDIVKYFISKKSISENASANVSAFTLFQLQLFNTCSS